MSTAHHFHELRQRLADCTITLRQVKDAYEVARAIAEQNAVESGRATGKNAEERARSLTIALLQNSAYTAALRLLRTAEADRERVEALLESALDERRHSEWQIRARLADALLGAAIASDGPDSTGDGAFDDTLGGTIDAELTRAARSVYVSDPYDHAMHVG